MNSGWPGAILSPASVSAARTSGVDLAATAGLFYGGAFALVGSRLARARLPFVIVVFAEHPALGAPYVLNVKVMTTRASVSSVRSHVAASSLIISLSAALRNVSAAIQRGKAGICKDKRLPLRSSVPWIFFAPHLGHPNGPT